MALDLKSAIGQLEQWEKSVTAFHLPSWEELPALPLYMDQVIFLLNDYLSLFSLEEGEEKQVTSAMVNNYVKNKLVPAPIKKRYGKMHLAYLIMVCLLKQSMNTADIPSIVPVKADEDAVKAIYAAFSACFLEAAARHGENIRQAAQPLAAGDTPVECLIFQTAAQANLSRILTQRLLHLDRETEQVQE